VLIAMDERRSVLRVRARAVSDAGGDNGVIEACAKVRRAIRQMITCWFCQADCAVQLHTLSLFSNFEGSSATDSKRVHRGRPQNPTRESYCDTVLHPTYSSLWGWFES
jgi:hypothetical protein